MFFKKKLQVLFIFLCLYSLLISSYSFLLYKVGELNIVNIVKTQLKNDNTLFSSGINQNIYSYKNALRAQLDPEAILFGSSRALQVRKEFFNTTFVNYGSTVGSLNELKFLAEKEKFLKLAIVYVDPWWFIEDAPSTKLPPPRDFPIYPSNSIIYQSVVLQFKYDWLNKYFNGSQNLGIKSILDNEGFSADGSYHYSGLLYGSKKSNDTNFQNTIARIDGNFGHLYKSNDIGKDSFNKFCSSVNKLASISNNVLLILPPFPKALHKLLSPQNGYGYFERLHELMGTCTHDITNAEFYDFTFNISLSNNCEYLDGMHQSEIVDARLFLQIKELSKLKESSKLINSEYLLQTISNRKQQLTGAQLYNVNQLKTVNFLKIPECEKND